MNIYRKNILDNGNIELNRLEYNDKLYDINKIDEDTFLLIKRTHIIVGLNELYKYNIEKSIVKKCIIDDEDFSLNTNDFKNILKNFYNKINNPIQIIKSSKIKLKTLPDDNYDYIENHVFDMKKSTNLKYIHEIINQCIHMKKKYNIIIETNEGIIRYYISNM